ncbi:20S proteasome subunit beta 6, partial [Clonorchis sinensis]
GNGKVLATTGFHGDVLTLTKLLENRVKTYRYDHGKEISTNAFAALLSVTLYTRRFFPFYVSSILGGLDEEGRGAVYRYDPVGSFERVKCAAAGSSGVILQPFLDHRLLEWENLKEEDKVHQMKIGYVADEPVEERALRLSRQQQRENEIPVKYYKE